MRVWLPYHRPVDPLDRPWRPDLGQLPPPELLALLFFGASVLIVWLGRS